MRLFQSVYANSVDPLIPELWAAESIRILEEEMVMGNLVHRDFSDMIAKYGDTVNTQKPSEFSSMRKTNADNVTTQDVTETNVAVVLNQWPHVSFVIKDGEMSMSFKDLVARYLQPAVAANARLLDRALLGHAVQFLANTTGALAGGSSSTLRGYIVDTDKKLNQQKAYQEGRNLVLCPGTRANALKTDLFVKVNESGGGSALRRAHLGNLFGFELFHDLNTPSSTTATSSATTTTASSAAGASTVAITAAVGVGTYVCIAGDMTPLRSTTNTTTLTPTRAIREATTSGAAVTKWAVGAVDLAAGYAAGYAGLIHVDGTGSPHVGQIVSFVDGSATAGTVRSGEYVIVYANNTAGSDYDIMLDRPLDTALADDDVVGYGPLGDYNFAFHKNALALVNRPLALPLPGTGARAAVLSYNGLSQRVVITYDGLAQGTRVTVDSLFGIKKLDTDLGCVMLA